MRSDVQATLKQFGFSSFRPGQEDIVNAVLDGRDTVGILPTGSGKTLCYQLPARIRGGVTVIVEPLLALMRDQVARLQQSGEKRVVALNSSLEPAELMQVLAQIDQYHFIFLAPEMLMRPDIIARLTHQVQLLVIDEAHCIFQWGPDFRPAYLELGRVRQQLQPTTTLALTATAPIAVRTEIVQGLQLNQPEMVVSSVDRPNLFTGVELMDTPEHQLDRLTELVKTVAGATVVYCTTKKQTEQVAATLATRTGRRTSFYHAGLDSHLRVLRERQFAEGRIDVLCATSAFGMGIDKSDIRMIVTLGVPQSLEEYMQAIGRAGRDGAAAVTVVLYTVQDVQRTRGLVDVLPSSDVVRAVYRNPEAYVQMDDSQVQLVRSYAALHVPAERVIQELATRLTVKRNNFSEVGAFLEAAACYRTALLQHFDSPAVVHHALCCGQVTPAVIAQLKPSINQPADLEMDWRHVFKRIFKNTN